MFKYQFQQLRYYIWQNDLEFFQWSTPSQRPEKYNGIQFEQNFNLTLTYVIIINFFIDFYDKNIIKIYEN